MMHWSSRLLCTRSLLLFAALVGTSQAKETVTQPSNHFINFLKTGQLIVQAGLVNAHQGKSQNVSIQNLIGDHFSVSNSTDNNALIGLGYYLNGHSFSGLSLQYGVNAYYLFQTQVKGKVTQEDLFTNLSYHYNVTNAPIYAEGKLLFKNRKSDRYQLIANLGIGPNIISTSGYKESPLNNDTLSDSIFKGRTHTAFSANAGIGIRINHVFPKPIECSYQYFYLGEGSLKSVNDTVSSSLKTGYSYANSLVCGLVF